MIDMGHIIITVLLVFLIYSTPGIILANLLWKSSVGKTEKLLFGSVIGLAFSCYISVTIAYFVGWEPAAIIGSILIFSGIGIAIKRKFPNPGRIYGSDPWTKSEFIACIASICFVSIFLYLAFSRVGLETDLGYRYSWLFGHDFINKAVNAVSLTHGVPSPHFFFAGETLRYYILSYSIAALAYSILGIEYSIHKIQIVISFFQAILFVFVITQFFKSWFRTRIICYLLVLCFLVYSFYGVFLLLRDQLVTFGAPSFLLKFSGVSHLFYRFFLVEPQTIMGLMVFLVVLSMMMRDEFSNTILPIFIVGFLIGIEFGIEAVLGMFLVITYGLVFLYRFLFRRMEFKRFTLVALCGAIPTILIYYSYYGIGIYSFSGEGLGLNFALNRHLLFAFPVMAIISCGPAALIGILALIPLFRRKIEGSVDAIVLMGILVILFMITVSHENEIVFGYLKGEKILFLVLLVLSGFFFQWLKNCRKKTKNVALLTLLIVSIFALLTPFMDSYRISFADEEGVTFVSYEDMEACNWIKRNLPKNAVVQSEPQYPGSKYAYSLIANFAERKMAIGERKASGVKHDRGNSDVPTRFYDIKKKLYKTLSIKEAHETCKEYGINYVYIGPFEKRIYPMDGIRKWESENELFKEVYNKLGVTIYSVL
jgi:hypothetical protein